MITRLLVAIVTAIVLTGCSDGMIRVADGEVEARYPDGWTEVPPSIVQSQLEGQLESMTGELRAGFELVTDEIDRGVIRAVVISPDSTDDFTEAVFVSIEEGDADLAAAAARRVDRMRVAAPSIEVSESDVELPIGLARRVEAISQPDGGSPIHLIEYIVLLEDGRTFTLTGTGPNSDGSLTDTMETMAQSLEAP